MAWEAPPLTEPEYKQLKAGIERDGLVYPVQLDRHGEIIDGHHRDRIADELGLKTLADGVSPIRKTLDVDDEKADRLRITLNLDRRQMSALDRKEGLAELAKKHIESITREAYAKREEGRHKGGQTARRGRPKNLEDGAASKLSEDQKPRSSGKRVRQPQTRDLVAEKVNEELAERGQTTRVTGKAIADAVKVAALPADAKERIRSGTSTEAEELAKAKPTRRVVRRQKAPGGAQTAANARPLARKAKQVQRLLDGLMAAGLDEVLAEIPPRERKLYTPEGVDFWSDFIDKCQE